MRCDAARKAKRSQKKAPQMPKEVFVWKKNETRKSPQFKEKHIFGAMQCKIRYGNGNGNGNYLDFESGEKKIVNVSEGRTESSTICDFIGASAA